MLPQVSSIPASNSPPKYYSIGMKQKAFGRDSDLVKNTVWPPFEAVVSVSFNFEDIEKSTVVCCNQRFVEIIGRDYAGSQLAKMIHKDDVEYYSRLFRDYMKDLEFDYPFVSNHSVMVRILRCDGDYETVSFHSVGTVYPKDLVYEFTATVCHESFNKIIVHSCVGPDTINRISDIVQSFLLRAYTLAVLCEETSERRGLLMSKRSLWSAYDDLIKEIGIPNPCQNSKQSNIIHFPAGRGETIIVVNRDRHSNHFVADFFNGHGYNTLIVNDTDALKKCFLSHADSVEAIVINGSLDREMLNRVCCFSAVCSPNMPVVNMRRNATPGLSGHPDFGHEILMKLRKSINLARDCSRKNNN